ncbi:MAG: T9SS type A sorting domain-containing protein [Bacteroidales bacterium]|jgi:hypothetical protein
MKKILLITFLAFIMNACLLIGTAKAQQFYYDTVSFEKHASEIVIDTTGGNLWQIGKPQKTFFNSAHSGTKAILTDTINDYTPNDTSSFIYIIRNLYTQTCQTCMEFWHKYDMDSTGDKGIIDASYDGGKSWVLLKDTFGVPPRYTTIQWQYDYHASNGSSTAHKLITSGKSDGWIQSSVCWFWYAITKKDTIIAMPDSLMIKFTFISDASIKNKEGWMIDDIVTSAVWPQDCVGGIKGNNIRENVSVFPNPATSEIQVIGNQSTVISIDIYNMLGEKVYQSLVTGHSLSGVSPMTNDPMTINVSSFPSGMYFVEIKTEKGVAVKKFIKE